MAVDWDTSVLAPLEDVFGEPGTFIPAIGASYPIVGVFDSAYRDVSLIDTGLGANTEQPCFGVRAAQFAAFPLQGDQVRIPSVGKLFFVRDVQPDGHGSIKLMLADSTRP